MLNKLKCILGFHDYSRYPGCYDDSYKVDDFGYSYQICQKCGYKKLYRVSFGFSYRGLVKIIKTFLKCMIGVHDFSVRVSDGVMYAECLNCHRMLLFRCNKVGIKKVGGVGGFLRPYKAILRNRKIRREALIYDYNIALSC